MSFLGVRGIGSVYYIACASGHIEFTNEEDLWALVAFTVFASAVVHGLSAQLMMRHCRRTSVDLCCLRLRADPFAHASGIMPGSKLSSLTQPNVQIDMANASPNTSPDTGAGRRGHRPWDERFRPVCRSSGA